MGESSFSSTPRLLDFSTQRCALRWVLLRQSCLPQIGPHDSLSVRIVFPCPSAQTDKAIIGEGRDENAKRVLERLAQDAEPLALALRLAYTADVGHDPIGHVEGMTGRVGVAQDRGMGEGGDDGPLPGEHGRRQPCVDNRLQCRDVLLPDPLHGDSYPFPGAPAFVVGRGVEDGDNLPATASVRAGIECAKRLQGAEREELAGISGWRVFRADADPIAEQLPPRYIRPEVSNLIGKRFSQLQVASWTGQIGVGCQERRQLLVSMRIQEKISHMRRGEGSGADGTLRG